MRALHLDFLHPAAPRLRLGLALLALGIAASGAVAWRHYVLITQIDELGTRVADTDRLARRDLPRMREAASDPKLVAQEVSRANAVLASLTLPWDAMFGGLEAASNPGVALLGVQPAANGRQVRLIGEAHRFEDLLAYIARLEATGGFANVFLASHELKQSGAAESVAFTLNADWAGRR